MKSGAADIVRHAEAIGRSMAFSGLETIALKIDLAVNLLEPSRTPAEYAKFFTYVATKVSQMAAPTPQSVLLTTSCARLETVTRMIRSNEVEPGLRGSRQDTLISVLAGLTPAGDRILEQMPHRPKAAMQMLADQLDLTRQQMELALISYDATLVGWEDREDPLAGALARAAAIERDTLAKAGGHLTLTEAARRLGVTRQAAHQRIQSGSLLGLMHEDMLVLPRDQFIGGGTAAWKVLPGFRPVLRLFGTAGKWSALQWLVSPDPNLGQTPFEALRAGRAREVAAAAAGYVGEDTSSAEDDAPGAGDIAG